MITYSELYELLTKEKYNEQLQPVSKEFYKELSEYFQDKKKITEKESDEFSEVISKTKKQLSSAVTALKELMTKRQKKIIQLALIAAKTGISKRDAENMLESEQQLFEIIVKQLEIEEAQINNLINCQNENRDLKNQLVRFKKDTAEFIDANENKIGPFKEGEIANLPKEITAILIKGDQADLLDES